MPINHCQPRLVFVLYHHHTPPKPLPCQQGCGLILHAPTMEYGEEDTQGRPGSGRPRSLFHLQLGMDIAPTLALSPRLSTTFSKQHTRMLDPATIPPHCHVIHDDSACVGPTGCPPHPVTLPCNHDEAALEDSLQLPTATALLSASKKGVHAPAVWGAQAAEVGGLRGAPSVHGAILRHIPQPILLAAPLNENIILKGVAMDWPVWRSLVAS
ncbi:hypothetical protein BDN70DRAFT_901417 [Pholiota conissans]|uniref:Uncharacterized protein n=1 Tax=Pholiota conissans TaxID=109636 RepID=A0A9P5YPK0_9AGAR|nr:hypothetical protein BDN70DRAFT_901417 [Pholiota conissans]